MKRKSMHDLDTFFYHFIELSLVPPLVHRKLDVENIKIQLL